MKPFAANSIRLEVCVDCAASALAAERGGAHRLELAAALDAGGLTPSLGFIAAIRARIALPLHVLVRPRTGDFRYSEDELEIMRRDIEATKQLGADGVVLGVLTPEDGIDFERTREFISLARPLAVTFHRAFDLAADPYAALEQVIAAGADRLLTSGGEATAEAGIPGLARLVRAARGRISILPGGGITAENAPSIAAQTGVRELHGSLRSPGRATQQPAAGVSPGSLFGGEFPRRETTEENVRALLAALAAHSNL